MVENGHEKSNTNEKPRRRKAGEKMSGFIRQEEQDRTKKTIWDLILIHLM